MIRQNDGLKIEQTERNGLPAARLTCGDTDMLFDGDELEMLIQHLALYRSMLRPVVPVQLLPAHDYPVCFEPLWFTESNLDINGRVILLRHAGFGWLGFAFSHERLKRLRADLAAQIVVVKKRIQAMSKVEKH